MKVGLVYPMLPPARDGGADFVSNLANALTALGVDVHLLADRAARPLEGRSVTVHPILDCSPSSRPPHVSDERRRLAPLGLDVLHVIHPCSTYPDTYWYPGISTRLGLPVVATIWGFNLRSPQVSLKTKTATIGLLRRAQILTTHEPQFGAVLRYTRPFRRSTVHLIPVGSNIPSGEEPVSAGERERYRQALRWTAPTLAYFGGIDPSRGVEDLLGALQIVRSSIPKVRLVMIGGAPDKYRGESSRYYVEVRALASQIGIDDAIEWTPFLPSDEVRRALIAADLVVLPFRFNSLGRSSLAAAMSLACPIVIAAPRHFTGFLDDGQNCLIAPRRHPDALAAAICRVLREPLLRERIAAGARDSGRLFAWESIARQTVAAYMDAEKRNRRLRSGWPP